jgi:hypothetical protein
MKPRPSGVELSQWPRAGGVAVELLGRAELSVRSRRYRHDSLGF